MKYSFNYTYNDKDDKDDKSWHICHGFGEGYFWLRKSDDSRVYQSELELIDIKFKDFPDLEPDVIDYIAFKCKRERLERLKLIEEGLKKNPIEFGTLGLPNIKSGFPNMSISDIISDNPIIENDLD